MSSGTTTPPTISTTANYCGDQYNNKGCACTPQVTPGLTPATESAANTTLICAYQENGIQYGCDAGCCPGGTCAGSPGATSNVTATTSTTTTTSADSTTGGSPRTTIYWAMLALIIVFAVFLAFGIAYATSRKR
jgi:hypothetical protein